MRNKISFLNSIISFSTQFFNLIFSYITRLIFAKYLGATYLGIENLFVNIIGVLGVFDLGLNIVMYQVLYMPIFKKDYEYVGKIISFFRKIFSKIGVILIFISLIISPFIHLLIKNNNFAVETLSFYFILYSLYSYISYFFIHYKSLLIADQKGFIVLIVEFVARNIIRFFQIICLIYYKSFAQYIVLDTLYVIISGVYLTLYSKKKYKFKNKNELINTETKLLIFNNIKNLAITKISNAGIGSTDSILVSYFLGTFILAQYSNYYMLLSAAFGLFGILINSITPSIASFLKENKCNENKSFDLIMEYDLFSNFIGLIYVFSCLNTINYIIKFSFGSEYLINNNIVIVIIINYYIQLSTAPLWNIVNIEGIFNESKYISLCQFFVNIIFSIILVKSFSLIGIFLGTFISHIISIVMLVNLLRKKIVYFNYKIYLYNFIKNFFVTSIFILFYSYLQTDSNFLSISKMAALLLYSFIFLLVLVFLFYYNNKYTKNILNRIKLILKI